MLCRRGLGRPFVVWLIVCGGTIISKALSQDTTAITASIADRTQNPADNAERQESVMDFVGVEKQKGEQSLFPPGSSANVPDSQTSTHTTIRAINDEHNGREEIQSGTVNETISEADDEHTNAVPDLAVSKKLSEISTKDEIVVNTKNETDANNLQTSKQLEDREPTTTSQSFSQRVNDKESSIAEGHDLTLKEDALLEGSFKEDSENIDDLSRTSTLMALIPEANPVMAEVKNFEIEKVDAFRTEAMSISSSEPDEPSSGNPGDESMSTGNIDAEYITTESITTELTKKMNLNEIESGNKFAGDDLTSLLKATESEVSEGPSDKDLATTLKHIDATDVMEDSQVLKTTENRDLVTDIPEEKLIPSETQGKPGIFGIISKSNPTAVDLDAEESFDIGFKAVEDILKSEKDRKAFTFSTDKEYDYESDNKFTNAPETSKGNFEGDSDYEVGSRNMGSDMESVTQKDLNVKNNDAAVHSDEDGAEFEDSSPSHDESHDATTEGLTTKAQGEARDMATGSERDKNASIDAYDANVSGRDEGGANDSDTEHSENVDGLDIADFEATEHAATLPELEINSTRIPKRIQGSQSDSTDSRRRIRPARPDPEYSYSADSDFYRPYQSSGPSYHRSQRPGSDSRPPSRQDTDASRPQNDPHRPSQEGTDYFIPIGSSDLGSSRSQRPQNTLARPYRPQGSFGRPYRPDRDQQKPATPTDYFPKSTNNFSPSSMFDMDYPAASQPGLEHGGSSYGDSSNTKSPESDGSYYDRPSIPDVSRPYRPSSVGIKQPLPPADDLGSDFSGSPRTHFTASIPSKPSEYGPRPVDKPLEEGRKTFAIKPDKATSEEAPKQSGAVYPRPGFGSNYGSPLITSPRPFNLGTPTSTKNLTKVEFIKADCFDNHMKVSIRFNGSFSGLVYSSGYSQDYSCSYINGSGRYHYEFIIKLNKCGTLGQQEVTEKTLSALTRRRQERAQYLVNSVTVQYNPLIEEDIDEHFRVTCEYGSDFWRTVTFPVVSVETYLSRTSAMKVRTGSPVVFTLAPPQCSMEIRSGYGHTGSRVSGPVNVGDPLTLVIHMKSEASGFDISVSNCFAHNGAQKRLQLIDSNGCAVQSKLASPFRGVNSPDRPQQVTLFSYLKAFRFTGSPALYIECDVHMCHGSCPSQRCYWRHVYKRSADLGKAEPSQDSVISESVSLFQALEVRHDESENPNSLAIRTQAGHFDEDMFCLRTAGFSAILASLSLLLLITSVTSICLCTRMRRMKAYLEYPDTKNFIKYDDRAK